MRTSATTIVPPTMKNVGILARLTLLINTVLIGTLMSTNAIASGKYQTLGSIRETVRMFAIEQHEGSGRDTEIEVGHLDSRLRLARCSQPLSAFSPHDQARPGHMTVGVRCEGNRPWTLYVPVRVNSYINVLTLTASKPRGSTLNHSDLRAVRKNIATLPHGYFTDMEEVLGMEVRRPLRPGDVLSPNAVTQPRMVTRGQEVWLIAEAGSISVTAKATALQHGSQGDRIQVRNLSSGRVIEAEVIDENRVRTAL
ncbi:flagella basal body P-ring formation protein FlgA [Alkalilimnicola ehrlichii]|uniref:Flagella basal body P-ring formation protein FlgA n=1 Tax=Alkalilimnicola ehrlichii TaxID=351052 RepID=A0A3E0WRX9_9GAMM|nr:flagellar basal body P-ring formation chaperone FlgA [Alkalilimnicola ehrlichii]RFA28566.1 flagella basal body P-ring formation protein FlgA [Alkalilimnicola ehrlichii]RFA35730.1 flagella basal body P-ring formation protein FlgA [Alkalilimnicola ehrlichii]